MTAERDEKLAWDIFLVPFPLRLDLIAAYRAEIEQAAEASVQELKEEIESLRRVNLLLQGRERHDEMIEAIRRI